MVARVALATQALFLILLVITPHLVLAGASHGGGKKGGAARHKKPAKPYKPMKRPAPHGQKPTAHHHKPAPTHKPVAHHHKHKPMAHHHKPAPTHKPVTHHHKHKPVTHHHKPVAHHHKHKPVAHHHKHKPVAHHHKPAPTHKPVTPHKPAVVPPHKPVALHKPVAPHKPAVVPPHKPAPTHKPVALHKPVAPPAVVPPHKPVVNNRKPAAPYRPIVQSTSIPRPGTAAPAGPGGNAGKGNGAGITYHGGPLLSGEVNLSILFYGQWQSRSKDLIRSFINSFGIAGSAFCKWRGIVESYSKKPITFNVGTQQSDDNASLGKALNVDFIKMLVNKANPGKPNSIAVIFVHKDIGTQKLCRGKCYDHGSFDGKLPYLIVANPEVECPGACGLPFTKASYGPPGPVVKPPNGDMGVDAAIVHFASGLASVLTNPLKAGFSKPGPKTWAIEAGNACENNFGKLTIDAAGVGYNAVGEKNLRFVLPAIWDPTSNACWAPM